MDLEGMILNLVKEKQKIKNNEIKFPLIQSLKNDDLNVSVTFVYVGDINTKNVLVISPLGERNISKSLMVNIENSNVWYKTYRVRNDIKFRYYFSVNDSLDNNWGEKIKNRVHDVLNESSLKFDDKTEMSYVVMPKCKDIMYKNKNLNTGKLIRCSIYSNFLKELKSLKIYTPYKLEEIDRECGVIIFLDGKEHINLLNANLILDKLILENKIKPVIGVFIESNDQSRSRDFKYNKMFEKFIINEVIPLIKKRYNGIGMNPYKNTITGFSLGGLMGTYIALGNSNVFRNVISQSGAYHFKENIMRKRVKNCSNKLNVYMDIGILEDKKMMIKPNNRMYAILRKKRFNIKYELFKSGHDYLSWGETLYRGLIYINGKANRS